jgi:flagellar biosynthetic protein FlhB
MAEEQDKESKTEEASEKKIRDAIDKGNTPFSKETPILFSLLAILFIAAFVLPERMALMSSSWPPCMDQSYEYQPVGQRRRLLAYPANRDDRGLATIPVFLALIFAGIAGSAAQNTPRFVGERIKPQMSRISLIKGWGRIFSAKGFANFLNPLRS